MSIYERGAATATRMLAKHGEAAVIRRAVISGSSPSDASAGTTAETDYACRLVVFPVDQKDIDGTTIKAGDFRVIVAPLTIVPVTTDRIVCSAGTLAIVDAGKFAPAGTVTHYDMVARL